MRNLESGAKIVVGTKEVLKAVMSGRAAKVYLAANAQERVTAPLREQCVERGVTIEAVPTMLELGKLAQIHVGAAAVAVLKSC